MVGNGSFIYKLCQPFWRDIRRVGPSYMLFFFGLFHICKCKSQFIAKYNYKDFVLLSPQRVAINGAIICRGFEPGLSRSRVRHSTARPRLLHMRIKFSTPCSPVLCFFFVYSFLLFFSFFLSFGVHMFSLLDGLQLLQSFSPRGITISVSLFVFTHFPDLCSYFFILDLLSPPYYHRPSQHNFLLQTAYFRNMFSKSLHPAFFNLSLMLHIKYYTPGNTKCPRLSNREHQFI